MFKQYFFLQYFELYRGDHFYWWWKPEYMEKHIDMWNRSTWRNIPTCETGVHGETYRHVETRVHGETYRHVNPEYMEKHTDMWNRSTWRNIPTCGNRSTWRNIPTCGKSLITSSLKVITSTPSHRLEPNSHVYMGSYILFLYVKNSFSYIFQSVH